MSQHQMKHPANMYGLPEFHKDNWPLRLVLSAISTSNY